MGLTASFVSAVVLALLVVDFNGGGGLSASAGDTQTTNSSGDHVEALNPPKPLPNLREEPEVPEPVDVNELADVNKSVDKEKTAGDTSSSSGKAKGQPETDVAKALAEYGYALESPIVTAPVPTRDWAAVKNPTPATAESIQRGRSLYLGKALCFLCHGEKGDGFGPVRNELQPPANGFVDESWQDGISDGQIMQVMHEGVFGTSMVAYVPDFLSENDAWDIVNYLRTLRGKLTEQYEKLRARRASEAARIESLIKKQKKLSGG